MSISPEIKYDFNQLVIGLEACIADLELKLQQIMIDIPVFILQTGDTSYYLNKKFIEIENKEIYQKIPRFVMSIEDIQPLAEQNSNQYNVFQYRKDEENYIGKGRRVAQQIILNTDFVSSNFIKALENYEVMQTIIAIPNVFTYEFMGNTFEGAYNSSSNSMEKPALDVSSTTRNFSVKIPLEVQIHLLVPRINSLKKLSDSKIDPTYQIQINGDPTAFDTLNPNNT